MLDRIGFTTRSEFRGPLIATKTTTNPAANTEFSITVPAGEAWLLYSVTVQVVQGITQTPYPSLTVKDAAGTLVWQAPAGTVAMNASVTAQLNWGPGVPTIGGAADTTRFGTLPNDLLLGPGAVIASLTAGIGANTDYGAASLLVLRYS